LLGKGDAWARLASLSPEKGWSPGFLVRSTGFLALRIVTGGVLSIATLDALGIAAEGALGPAAFLVPLRLATVGSLRTATFGETGARRGYLR
jgi:hypothetical protein